MKFAKYVTILVLLLISCNSFAQKKSVYHDIVNFYHNKSVDFPKLLMSLKENPELKALLPSLKFYNNVTKKKFSTCSTNFSKNADNHLENLFWSKGQKLCKSKNKKRISSIKNDNPLHKKYWESYRKAKSYLKQKKYQSSYYWTKKCLTLSYKINEKKYQRRSFFLAKDFLRQKKYYYGNKVLFSLLKEAKHLSSEKLHKFILISFFEEHKYTKALRHIKKHEFYEKREELSSTLLFWVGIHFERKNKKTESDVLYNTLIKNHPMSFYATLRINQLSKKEIKSQRALASVKPVYTNKISLSPALENSLKLIAGFAQTQDFSFASASLSEANNNFTHHYESLIEKTFTREEFELFKVNKIINIFEKENLFLFSFKTLSSFLNNYPHLINERIIQVLFPNPYDQIISNTKYKVDKGLLVSLIRQESAFNPKALSRVGARGLMQIMPATAKRIDRKIKKKDLFKPKKNIPLGSKYLAKLMKKFDNNPIYALAAYNAGERRLKIWVKEFMSKNRPLTALELIPFKETRNYVKFIYRNYFYYQAISPELMGKTNFKFNKSLAKH